MRKYNKTKISELANDIPSNNLNPSRISLCKLVSFVLAAIKTALLYEYL